MKTTVAIVIMGLLLFNWFGYRVMIACLQDKAGLQLEDRLDSGRYDESQLLSIKVPAGHLSSYSLSGQFERTNGQVEIKGVKYKYVKKRLYDDSLEFICIADHAGMKLEFAKTEIFKQLNDLQHNGQEKKADSHPGSSKNFISDDYTINDPFLISGPGCMRLSSAPFYLSTLSTVFLSIAEQPPEYIA